MQDFGLRGGVSIAGFPMDVRLMHPWLELLHLDDAGGGPIECIPIRVQNDNWIAAVASTDHDQPQDLGAGGTPPASVYLYGNNVFAMKYFLKFLNEISLSYVL